MAELPTQRDFEDFTAWSGRDVLDPDGGRLGAVDAIFLDEATGTPEWVLVNLGDDDAAFVPLVGASVEESAIRVGQPPDRISGAPRPDPGETISVADERRLYEHYGLAYSEQASETLLPEGTEPTEERPRLRKHLTAPTEPEPDPRPDERAAAGRPEEGEGLGGASGRPDAPRSPGDESEPTPTSIPTPTATSIPEPAPTVVPPEGGFQAHEEESGSRLPAVLKGRSSVAVGVGAAVAGLIALLVWRRRR